VRISHPWARALTLSLLKDFSNGVSGWIAIELEFVEEAPGR
jgi:hypothetical protein